MSEKQVSLSQPWASSIGPEMVAYLNTQVEVGEQVLWAGTTNVSGRIRRLRPFVILCVFMLLFCSASVLLMNNPSWLFLLLTTIFVWVGIPAFVVWRQSKHLRDTLYAVTNRRALILSLGNPARTESYPPEKIEFIKPVAKAGGRGSLYFTVWRGKGQQRHQRFNHGFLDIAAVEQVATLMRRTFLSDTSPPPGLGEQLYEMHKNKHRKQEPTK